MALPGDPYQGLIPPLDETGAAPVDLSTMPTQEPWGWVPDSWRDSVGLGVSEQPPTPPAQEQMQLTELPEHPFAPANYGDTTQLDRPPLPPQLAPTSLPPTEQALPQAPQVDAAAGGQLPQEQPVQSPEGQPEPTEADYLAMAKSDPDALAGEQYRIKQDEEKHQAEFAAQKVAQDAKDAVINANAVRDAAARADAESIEIARQLTQLGQQKTDPERWWHSRTTAQKAGAWLGALAGGLLRVHQGGRNMFVEEMQKTIDNDIHAQEMDMQNQRELLGMRQNVVNQIYARSQNVYQAREAVRLASWQHLETELKIEAAKYDPKGSTAMGYAEAIMGARAQREEAARKLADWNRKDKIENEELRIKQAAEIRQEKERRQAAAESASNRQQSERHWLAEHGQVPDPNSPTGYSPDPRIAAGGDPEARKKAAEAEIAERKAAEGRLESPADEKVRTLGVAGIKRKDGNPVLVGTTDEAKGLREKKAATDEIARLLDQTIALRKEYGWSSDLWNSPEYQQAKANWGKLKLAGKTSEQLGAISGSDAELLEDTYGAKDPTSVKDPLPGMEQARRNTVNSFNDRLTAADPNAERYEPPVLEARKAQERSKEENIRIITDPFPPGVPQTGETLQSVQDSKAAALRALARQGSAGDIRAARQQVGYLVEQGLLRPEQADEWRRYAEGKLEGKQNKEVLDEANKSVKSIFGQ